MRSERRTCVVKAKHGTNRQSEVRAGFLLRIAAWSTATRSWSDVCYWRSVANVLQRSTTSPCKGEAVSSVNIDVSIRASYWKLCIRRMREASHLPVDIFPGMVALSSYFAMRSAAVTVLLSHDVAVQGLDASEMIDYVSTVLGDAGKAHGAALRRALKLHNEELADAVSSVPVDEARWARNAAYAFVVYCSATFSCGEVPAVGQRRDNF